MPREQIREDAANGLKRDLYFSVDVETTGPTPIRNHIRSIGAAVIRHYEIIAKFERNILPQHGAIWEDDALISNGMGGIKEFWRQHPVAEQALMVNRVSVSTAFQDFADWVETVRRENEVPVFLAYPGSFDFMFCSVLASIHAPGTWPFGFAAFCMQSFAASQLKVQFSQARTKNWPIEWSGYLRHTHIAIEDALDQAAAFIAMQAYRTNF